ncbi:hypothetical protein CDD81_1497 [Ophiocordyceps australis]|uniref:37S ribosomal protein S22 n=1 Tax=Ophiocordyceps australis TaxID=1399860 RepID=A0A2C5YE64_9HYPO|nr:hypothetical protein CDD81_1497 [Ophiocordyceps australis]
MRLACPGTLGASSTRSLTYSTRRARPWRPRPVRQKHWGGGLRWASHTSGESPGQDGASEQSTRAWEKLSREMQEIAETGEISKTGAESTEAMEENVFSEEDDEEPFIEHGSQWEAGEDRTRPAEQPYRWGEAATRKFHANTLDGKFVGIPRQVLLPEVNLMQSLRAALTGVSTNRLRDRAEYHYGGRGLPHSLSPRYLTNSRDGSGLLPDTAVLDDMDTKAFLAVHLPPAYVSVFVILREIRRRLGPDWIQSRLANGGLSVLDAGGGGAGIAAWNEICDAEWGLLEDQGKVQGPRPKGNKETIVAASQSLREHLRHFFPHASYMHSLPDYVHSGNMSGEHLDGGQEQLPRKKFDVVIASHNLVPRKQYWKRRQLLHGMWNLVEEEGGVLVVIERGDGRGAQAVGDIRDTLLREILLPQPGDEDNEELGERYGFKTGKTAAKFKREVGHLIAPCTNHAPCPMWRPNAAVSRDYCHFSYRYWMPTFYRNLMSYRAEIRGPISGGGDVKFSYVVVRRGEARKSTLSGAEATAQAMRGYPSVDEKPDGLALPRLVLPPIKRKGHICLDVCTPEGQIKRWTIPKSYGKQAFHDVRKASWGDLWALGAKTEVERKLKIGATQIVRDARRKHARQSSRLEARKQVAALEDGRAREAKRNREVAAEFDEEPGKKSGRVGVVKEVEEEMEKMEEDEEEEEMDEESRQYVKSVMKRYFGHKGKDESSVNDK